MPRDVGSPRALTLDSRGNIYASGDIRTTLAMPTGQVFRNAEGSYDAYVLKLAVAPGITIGSSIGLTTSENGGSTPFSVVLDTPPTGDVTITLTSRDTTEGIVSPGMLTFTPANWNIPQVVVITGVDDTLFDGDIAYSIDLSATSNDPGYNGLQPSSVSVKNLDNDVPSTKFYVVDDASANRTYEYAANGAAVENYSLASGNTAPRGAASTTAGDKTWVVDANRKVYVYNNSGGLLGSWTAGTLASNATVEGIATNGTDVWIVDAKSDKVYKYAGAASTPLGQPECGQQFQPEQCQHEPERHRDRRHIAVGRQ